MADGYVVVLCVLWLTSLGFIAWREVEHRKQIDALTSKLMSKNYGEYACYKNEEKKEAVQKQDKTTKKHVNDPVLGNVY